jgi:hypothetical protein
MELTLKMSGAFLPVCHAFLFHGAKVHGQIYCFLYSRRSMRECIKSHEIEGLAKCT